ncbi:MAG: MATE family efflux transporter [Chitinophagales bacterium]|nr:MATE family efflux transporter [Chitinophagales bacterium]
MKALSYSYKDILKIAFPLMVSNFFFTLIAVTDIGFMREIGVTEQAAIGYISLLYLFFFMTGFSYTRGAQILIAKKDGQKKHKAIGLILDNMLVVLMGGAFLLWAILAFFGRDLLELALQDQEVIQASYEYLRIRKWGFFASFLGSALIAYYSGIGRTKILAVAIVSMSLSNIFLNWVLIFGHFGFKAYGIQGAAYASNLAEILSTLIMLAGLVVLNLRHKNHLFYFGKIKKSVIMSISSLSFPLVLQTLIGLAAWVVFFTLIEKLGKAELAISNNVKQIYTLLGIPTYALASSTNTVIGNLVGQGKIGEIIPTLKRIILVSSICIFIFTLPTFLFPRIFLDLISEPGLVSSSIGPLFVALVALQLYGFSTILFNCIASFGASIHSLVVEVLTIILYLIYIYFLFYKMDISISIAWTTEWFYWGTLAILSLSYLYFYNWRKKL